MSADSPDLPPSRAQHFVSLADLIAQHPRLDRAHILPVKYFGGLLNSYSLKPDEWQFCRLSGDGLSVCKQRHGRGWVARDRRCGTEVFIGLNCAHDHLGADSSFAAERRRVTEEIKTGELLRRLRERLADAKLERRLCDAINKAGSLIATVQTQRGKWPQRLLLRLSDMARTGNRRVGIRVEYVERDERGRETRTYVAAPIGDVVAPGALDAVRLLKARSGLSAAAASLRQGMPTANVTSKQLQARLRPLDEANSCEGVLAQVVDDLSRFNSHENLRLLPWLVRDDVRSDVAKQCLQIAAGRSISNAEVAQWLQQQADAIRTAHGGRRFTVEA